MELTDGDGRTNRLRYRRNRVRWANPHGHLAKAEPPGPPRRARPGQPLCARPAQSQMGSPQRFSRNGGYPLRPLASARTRPVAGIAAQPGGRQRPRPAPGPRQSPGFRPPICCLRQLALEVSHRAQYRLCPAVVGPSLRQTRQRLRYKRQDLSWHYAAVLTHTGQCISTQAGNARYSAPMRAIVVKRAYGSGPVATCCRPGGLTDCCSGSFFAAARSFPSRGRGSGWSARSRAAARTNELDAGERREIIEGEEGGFGCGLACQGSRACPGAWHAEWSRKHPSGAAPACGRLP
jgi:hypothetical protein